MKKFSVFLAFLLFLGVQVVDAQDREITGVVTSADDGLSLPGVSVVVKGTTIGTITNLDGVYILSVPETATTLVFSFVGMKTTEVEIGGLSTIDLVMEADILGLDEVVVVAYGVQRKEAKTGSVAVVKADEMKSIPVTSADKLLQGKVAGLQVNSGSGMPGSETEITIRGVGTINAGTEPLYVIDGVPVVSGNFNQVTLTGNVLSSLNPNNIESITVLKDAAAASVYGSRAANGVILITTKSGREGRTNFNLRAQTGISHRVEGDFRYMETDELLYYMRDAVYNIDLDPDDPALEPSGYYLPESILQGRLTDWWDLVFRTGLTQNYEVEASGGNDKTRFFTSGSYLTQEGIQIGSEMTRINFRLNLDHNVAKRAAFGAKVSAAYIDLSDQAGSLAFANPLSAAQFLLPWENCYNEDGTYNWDLPSNFDSNPVGIVDLNDQNDKQYKFLGSFYFTYDIIPGLQFKTINSIDLLTGEFRMYWHPDTPDGAAGDGFIWTGTYQNRTLTSTNTLKYNNSFADVHNLGVTAGYEVQHNNYNYYRMSGNGLGADIPYASNVSSNQDLNYDLNNWAFLSYLGILDYNFDSRYYLQASIRRDGSSRFGPDNKWATFWSVGASWNLHNESFMDPLTMVNIAKLRVSYGINGNAEIDNYASYGVYGSRTYNGEGGMAPDQLAYPTLTWENNSAFNAGLDFAIFERVQGSFEWYNRVTTDMLLDVPLSRTTGFNSLRQNIGEMKNSGIEFLLSGDVLRTPDYVWNLGLNMSFNDTEITDLAGEDVIGDGFWRRHVLNGDGSSQYYVYDWAGVNPANGNGLWWTEDPDTGERGELTEDYTQARRYYSGKVDPDYIGGITTSFRWKGLSISAYFNFSVGQSVYIMERYYSDSDGYSWATGQSANLLDYWKQPGDIVANPKPIPWNNSNSNAWGTSRFLEDGSYLRFKNLTLSYDLPNQWVEKVWLNSARIYMNAVNLYVWHDVSYWDPERTYTGGGYATFPNARTITFGIDLGF